MKEKTHEKLVTIHFDPAPIGPSLCRVIETEDYIMFETIDRPVQKRLIHFKK